MNKDSLKRALVTGGTVSYTHLDVYKRQVLDRVVEVIEAGHGPLPPLRLPQVKFLQPVLPGQAVQVCVEGAPPRWRFRVLHDDSVVASGCLLYTSRCV